MEEICNDSEYMSLVQDILENEEFLKIKKCIHHGLSRFDHCMRVSYYSYKISKKLNLNYKEAARAGLLHDFFTNDELNEKENKIAPFIHNKKALANSLKFYDLSLREKNIIFSHMFPLTPLVLPKYKESWVVSTVDKGVALYEFSLTKPELFKNKCIGWARYAFLFMVFCARFNTL